MVVCCSDGKAEAEAPESYRSNNRKEEMLLVFSENFQRQFRQLYADRKPLLLTPVNECGTPVSYTASCCHNFGGREGGDHQRCICVCPSPEIHLLHHETHLSEVQGAVRV